jgi:hypothetical protein
MSVCFADTLFGVGIGRVNDDPGFRHADILCCDNAAIAAEVESRGKAAWLALRSD